MPLAYSHEENKTNLQNADRKLFPENLKIVGHISEKKFAVPIWKDSLPEGSRFVNLSENYDNRGISQTPGYERLCFSFVTPGKVIDSITPLEDQLSVSYTIESDTNDAEIENEVDERPAPRILPETVAVCTISFDGVAMVTTDPELIALYEAQILREEKFEAYCNNVEKKLHKGMHAVPTRRRN